MVNSYDQDHDPGERFRVVPYYRLFRFTTAWEKCLLVLGVLSAMGSGGLFLGITNTSAEFTQALMDIENKYCSFNTEGIHKCSLTGSEVIELLKPVTKTFFYYAFSIFSLYSTSYCCLKHVAEKQLFRTKQQYFRSLIRQSPGWHDVNQSTGSESRLLLSGAKIQSAMGGNLAWCISLLISATLCLVNAFYYGWALTLVSFCFLPFYTLITYWAIISESVCAEEQELAYAAAGATASETLTLIKTVAEFSGEVKEINRYEAELEVAREVGINRLSTEGKRDGLTWFIFFLNTAAIVAFGTYMIQEWNEKEIVFTAEHVLKIYLSLISAAYNFGEGLSYFEVFAQGKIAATYLHSVIDQPSEIDPFSETGVRPSQLTGNISFRDVEFAYPSRRSTNVLRGINLTIPSGKTVALVGPSGSGKSSVFQLLQRLYDPDRGTIEIDGRSVKDYNVGWLRCQIGVVQQEPTVFAGSIADNVKVTKPDATMAEVISACRLANAHDFIMQFPMKYDTVIADGGSLSGGQKQRISIARSLLRRPSILCLDEATSALDVESQADVQRALEDARRGRTTLVIAHRLSTIINADLIFYIKDGQVLERGTHDQLMRKKGAYYKLKQNQETTTTKPSASKASGLTKAKESVPQLPVASGPQETNSKEQQTYGIFKVWALNYPEFWLILFGILCSLLQAGTQTVSGTVFSEALKAWNTKNKVDAYNTAKLAAGGYFALAVVAGLSGWGKGEAFAIAAENLTCRLRLSAFKAMVYQDIAWFDKNPVGSLCSRLAEDAATVQGAFLIGALLQTIGSTFFSLASVIFQSPEMAGVAFIMILFFYVIAFLEERYLVEDLMTDVANREYGSQLVSGLVRQIKTIASLHLEDKMVAEFTACVEESMRVNLKPLYIRGFVNGLTYSFSWFSNILLTFIGAYYMVDGKLSGMDIIAIGQTISFGTSVASEFLANTPGMQKSTLAANRIIPLINMRPTVDRDHGRIISPDWVRGKIDFSHVFFSYSSRPSGHKLQNITFTCPPGHHIAIVGPSGCGKSSCVKLFERFYTPTSGSIKLDDKDISTFNLDSFRKLLGIVSQEPSLFDRTIFENIAYGDNSKNIVLEDVILAARRAEIHEFISSLPRGYKTRVGSLGGLLSGGQRQRIVIARSLIREPRILLFDEATSALDPTTESLVQRTLDTISRNKTTITVSHHGSAVRNANLIVVLNANGQLLDKGTHDELLPRCRFYNELMSS